jgi:transposase-like protein
MRRRILEAIELVLEEELTEALDTGRYERGEARRGYRNGHQTRRITTAVGTQTLDVPRGRIVEPEGSGHEFRSQALPRYARRTREVDEAILGAHLAGEQLLIFYAYPKAMWRRSLRTTNTPENLNREFRRSTKAQPSFSSEESAVTLLYGLVAFGQIQLRKIDGHHHVSELLAPSVATAA